MASSPKPLGGIARAFAAMRGNTYKPPSQTIDSVSPSAWPSPLQPVQSTAPKGSQPLAFSYWNGLNLEITPRADSALTFADLRGLATYPLARICIENVKDILCTIPWKIQRKRAIGQPIQEWKESQKTDKTIPALTDFFAYPDGETPWADFWRPVIDDMLVVDAASILVQRNLGGKVVKLRWSDGTQFLRLIDDQGFTPLAPNPAFTQLWEGIPRLLLTTRQLLYRPSNIVAGNSYSSKIYGNSITQQMAEEIAIGQERLNFVLAYYKQGITGGMIHVIPAGTPPDKVSENMQWMNNLIAGNLGQRRKWNVTQGYQPVDSGKPDQIIETKEPVMADSFDDLHIKKMAFAYGVSAQRLMKQMNRACHSADTETLTENGWKLYDQIGCGEKIAQYNSEAQAIEFVVPSSAHVHEYAGEMVSFKSQNVDILVTPEHRMWLEKESTHRTPAGKVHRWNPASMSKAGDVRGPVRAVAAASFCGIEADTFTLPSVSLGGTKLTDEQVAVIQGSAGATDRELGDRFGVHSSTVSYARRHQRMRSPESGAITLVMDDWLEFLGYFLSEGGLSHAKGHYLLTLAQREDKYADQIESCLERLPFIFKRYPKSVDGMARWNVYGKNLCNWLMDQTGGYCWNKFIPREFMNLSTRQLGILFDAMMAGDGSWDKRSNRTSGSYATTSRQLANDVQEIGLKLGYSTSIRSHQDTRNDRRHRSYLVTLCERAKHALRSKNITREHYAGKVFCFTVPSGIFVTRRNGKVAFQGNSAEAGQDAAEKEGIMPRLKWFKGTIDLIIQRQMDLADYEVIFDTDDELDAVKQSTVDKSNSGAGLRTIDEIREDRGLVPFGLPETSQPIIVTATGVQPLEGSFDRVNQAMDNDTAAANKPAPKPVAVPTKKVASDWYAARY